MPSRVPERLHSSGLSGGHLAAPFRIHAHLHWTRSRIYAKVGRTERLMTVDNETRAA